MPMLKTITGHTGCAGVMDYLRKGSKDDRRKRRMGEIRKTVRRFDRFRGLAQRGQRIGWRAQCQFVEGVGGSVYLIVMCASRE